MEITTMTALEIARAIKNKEITCADAVNAVLDAIDATDGKINAYIMSEIKVSIVAISVNTLLKG